MDSWLTYPEYLAQHPGSALTEAEFTPRAVDAAFFIENATRWRASLAKEPEQLALLAQCQSRLVALSEEVSASWDGVTSVLNMKCVRILYKDPDSCGTLKLMLTLPASFLYCFFFDMITNLVVLFPSSFTSRFKISSPYIFAARSLQIAAFTGLLSSATFFALIAVFATFT